MEWNSCTKLQLPPEPLTRGLPPPDTRSLCPQLNLLNPPLEQNSWVRNCLHTFLTWWKRMVSFTSRPFCSLVGTRDTGCAVGETESQCACCWEEENLAVLLEMELIFLDPLRSLVSNFFFFTGLSFSPIVLLRPQISTSQEMHTRHKEPRYMRLILIVTSKP